MFISKGDRVKLVNGIEGEVIETWGYNRLFLRIRKDDGRIIPVMESDVADKIEPKKKSWGR